jgi:phage terminase large subunit
MQLNPNLRDFWNDPRRIKVLHGGRCAGKSHDVAGRLIWLSSTFRQVRVMACRQFQNKISESIYTLLTDKIADSGIQRQFKITNTGITHKLTGSEFLFYGLARNIAEVKSTERIGILLLEEAQNLTPEQWEILEPTIRADNSEIWVLFNSVNESDFPYQHFVLNTPENCISRQINFSENVFLNDTQKSMILSAYMRDPIEAAHIYGGVPKTGSDKSFIQRSHILSAIDAHLKIADWPKGGTRQSGFDLADTGEDMCARVDADRNIVFSVEEWRGQQDQILTSCSKVFNHALSINSDVVYDCCGLGTAAGSHFANLNADRGEQLVYHGFNAGAAVDRPNDTYLQLPHKKITNGDQFSNLKAQKWQEVATRFRKTFEVVNGMAAHPSDELVSIASAGIDKRTLNKLTIELSAPMIQLDGAGRTKTESKESLAKRGVPSPNIADALIMAVMRPPRSPRGFFA